MSKTKDLLRKIYRPLFDQLPFFVFFLALMGTGEIIWKLWYTYKGIPMSGQLSLNHLIGSLVIWILVGYILSIILNHSRRGIRKGFIYGIVLIMWAIQNFLRMEFGSPISPTYLNLLAETTPQESGEFIQQYIHSSNLSYTLKKLLLAVIAIIACEWGFNRIKGRIHLPGWLESVFSFLLIPVLLAGLYFGRQYVQLPLQSTVDNDVLLELPRDPFSCTYKSVIALLQTSKNTEECVKVSLALPDETVVQEPDSLNLIIIIGESYNKYHSQLYGYELDTTPELQKELEKGNLFLFYDVTAPSNMTSSAIKNILSTNSLGDEEPWYEHPYVPSVFHKAGFNVYFWDNQKQDVPQGSVEFSVHSLLYNSDIVLNSYTQTNQKAFQYDEEIVNDYIETVGHPASRYNFIIFHLMGQHFSAKKRYPDSVDNRVFTSTQIGDRLPFYDETVKTQVAEYDNATLYNDRVVKSIIDFFSQSNSVVVYFPDHADEVYDFRNQISRDQGNLFSNKLKYQYEIPFMIWVSDTYLDKHPEVEQDLIDSSTKPFMTDNLCHLLFHLAHIDSPLYIKSRDLLDSSYTCPPRLLYESGNYDVIRAE